MSSLPFKVKATHDYASPHEDDLKFPTGQIITVKEEEDDDWYVGEYIDGSGAKQEGLFPKNFVERYEPEAPPRPTRARPKKDPAPAAPAPVEPESSSVSPRQSEAEPLDAAETPPASPVVPKSEPSTAALSPKPTQQKPAPPVAAATAKSAAPPPVAEKPSSFKDRIAAFNKPSAQSIAPVKPGPPTGSSTNFIKKPFVAPPPSRDAYVPPPTRESAPQKAYRRDEDPEIAERQAQDQEDAERAGFVTSEGQEEEEETAKPTSLRDRIALLQKQQQEQAARRADVSQKEKPKRPAKKRTESSDQIAAPLEDEGLDPEQAASPESRQGQSMDSPHEAHKPTPGRRPSRDPKSPAYDIVSDGNEADQSGAGDTTEEAEADDTEIEDSNERVKSIAPPPPTRTSTSSSRIISSPVHEKIIGGDLAAEPEGEDGEEEEEEEEEDEMDEEARRKLELRERMAKMSGGMGMPGMFAMPTLPGSASKRKQSSGLSEQKAVVAGDQAPTSPPRAPMVPVPGLSKPPNPEVDKEPEEGLPLTAGRRPEEVPDVEDLEQSPSSAPRPSNRAAPPVPQERSLPPVPPSGARAPPPPVPGSRPTGQTTAEARSAPPPPSRPTIDSPGPGSESEDETTLQPAAAPLPPSRTGTDLSARAVPPPLPRSPNVPQRPEGPRSPPAGSSSHMSEANAIPSPSARPEKRASRVPPVPPGAPTMLPGPATESRPPPPPPPTAVPGSRHSTGIESITAPEEDPADNGESDYEGDYDTDIAAGASHKNALKSHAREPSLDESTLSEATPPLVPTTTLRGVPPPPPPPHQPPVDPRQSLDAPRVPPPAPPPIEGTGVQEDVEYDPYRHSGTVHLPTHHKARIPNRAAQENDPGFRGDSSPPRADRAAPPLPQMSPLQAHGAPPPPPRQSREMPREMPRQSMETRRTSMNAVRKSPPEQAGSSSAEQGQIAQDLDLSVESLWWASPKLPPPVIQGRPDVLCEFEESSTSRRGGRTSISKDVYILYQDYSQTVVTARFDSKDPSDVSLEQRHEPPPPRLRQDQLEEAHGQFGQSISGAATSKKDQTVGNGTAQALVLDAIQTQTNALLPIGTRTYGALIYANMANATVQQHDEIRPGDIITFRNAKFSGKHGAMHAKYSEEVGKPEHVGVVIEWDGTKKKVRALEQGRESKKVKVESFRVGDLRSGEVKVWRIMGRKWVGWDSN